MTGLVFPGRVFALAAFVVCTTFILACISRAKEGGKSNLRPIPGYEAIDEAVGRAVEMGRPVHFTSGYYGISLEIIAGLQSLKHVAGLTAEYDAELVATTARGDTYTMAEGIVRQAYAEANKAAVYKPEMVRYFSDNQYAFASGIMAILTREEASANIMMGQFAAESLLIAETGCVSGAIQIAGTASTAQLPFFVATCDYVVIGEELFAANAYFGEDPVCLGCIQGQDIIKAISVAMIAVGAVLATLGNGVLVELMKK